MGSERHVVAEGGPADATTLGVERCVASGKFRTLGDITCMGDDELVVAEGGHQAARTRVSDSSLSGSAPTVLTRWSRTSCASWLYWSALAS